MTLAENHTTPESSHHHDQHPDHHHDKPHVSWKQDRNAILLLFLLYVIQALPQGLLFITIPVTLMEKGSKYNDLLIISFSYIPFCFKSFVSPLLNTYYIKSFGRGKTYLVPALYLLGIIMFILAYKGEALFEKESIPFLNVISIFTILVLFFADICLDGWQVNLISKENSSYGAICPAMGFNLGFFLSFNLFLPLNSLEFCNNHIYSTPQKRPILEMSSYVSALAIGIFLVALWIHFFIKEKEPDHHASASVTEVIKTLKIFVTNSEFRKLLFIFSTWNIVFGPIHNLFPGMIMERGVSKELFTNISSPITPLIFVITMWLGSLCKKYSETKVASAFWILRLVATFMYYGTIVYLPQIPTVMRPPILFGTSLAGSITWNGISVALGSFASRISKDTFGGPLMSTFGAIGNISRLIGDAYVFGITHLIGWDAFALFTLFAMFVYAAFFVTTLKSFENKDFKTLVEGKVKHE